MAGGMAESAASDAKMMPYRPVEWKFEVDGELPSLDDDMSAWVFRAGAEPSSSRLEELRKAFAIDGDFTKNVSDPGTDYEWKTWMAGPSDGSGPSITVSSDSMLSWWYSEGWQTMATPSVACVEPAPSGEVSGSGEANTSGATSDAAVVAPCTTTEMTPPENVPSKSEAEDLFLSLAAELGWSKDDLILETWADEWSAGVSGWVKIDGVRTSLMVNASFGENGRITYAGGFLAEPEKVADYPQIGTEAALDRLIKQYSGGWGPYVRGGGIAVDDVLVSEEAASSGVEVGAVGGTEVPVDESTTTVPNTEPTDSTSVDSVPVADTVITDTVPVDDTMVIDSIPIDDTIPMETMTVNIESVEQEYVFLWGADGETYLVPGYAFIAAEDEWGYIPRYVVASIPDEYMEQVAPDMMPPVAEEIPSTDVAVPPVESAPVEISEAAADELVGMNEDQAIETAESNGWTWRIAMRDGESFPLTMDFRSDRVNFTIENGVVTAIVVG